MSIFARLFGIGPKIGVTKPICTYCEHRLDKMPGRKKRCPNSNNDIFVRTRPKDDRTVLIREDEIVAIEDLWARKNGTHKAFAQAQRHRKSLAQDLAARLNREPTKNEVELAVLIDEGQTHARDTDWASYSTTRYMMANLMRAASIGASHEWHCQSAIFAQPT